VEYLAQRGWPGSYGHSKVHASQHKATSLGLATCQYGKHPYPTIYKKYIRYCNGDYNPARGAHVKQTYISNKHISRVITVLI
jgi:hypothetical protein